MLIDENTKIAKLLKQHPDALETIISLSPDFKKLRNPLLRRLMAGRTSIKMAAKMGGCTPEDFFKVLKPLGFEATESKNPEAALPNATLPLPDYLQSRTAEQIVNLDVRQMIADGKDPLRFIQQNVKQLEPGQALKIVNSFEPVPLIQLLEKQGFKTFTKFISEDLVETFFYKTDSQGGEEIPTDDVSTSDDWDETLKNFEGKLEEIDVRHLEMPLPMMTILETLDTLPEGKALYVNHKRIPIFLLTELKDRNYEYKIKDVQEGEVYLIIYKGQ